MEKIKIEDHTFPGIWLIGWIFTIGFVGLSVKQAVYAIVIWPYYLGDTLTHLIGM